MPTSLTLTYEEAWDFLDKLQFFKIKLGLDSMTAFMESLGNPQRTFPCIHIGGTNGKGSVGATLLSILTEADYKVGFYTSPHLSSVRERFRVGNTFISRRDFTLMAEKIINILDGRQITYFEFTTALAMLWFAEQKVDLAILEVGLGGRLDATNIVTPLVSVITNVTMDHEQYLGNTITQVASEKAGIIKPGIPVITGSSDKRVLDVIAETAGRLGSPLYIMDRDFKGESHSDTRSLWSFTGSKSIREHELPINMRGRYQVNNASLALAALDAISLLFPVSPIQIRTGLQKVLWPGRLEEFRLTDDGRILPGNEIRDTKAFHFLLDGAHNPDGAIALKHSLLQEIAFDRLILIWASMADKDIHPTLMEIAPLADYIIFTMPDEERSANPEHLKEILPQHLKQKTTCIPSVAYALDRAKEKYTSGTLICVAGSLYLVGKARQILLGELVADE